MTIMTKKIKTNAQDFVQSWQILVQPKKKFKFIFQISLDTITL